MIWKTWLRRFTYLAAVSSFAVAALLVVLDAARAALALVAVGGVCLSLAVWWSARTLNAGSDRRARDIRRDMRDLRKALATGVPVGTGGDQVSTTVERVEIGLRDLPVIAQQSVVATEAIIRLETALDAVRSDLGQLSERVAAARGVPAPEPSAAERQTGGGEA